MAVCRPSDLASNFVVQAGWVIFVQIASDEWPTMLARCIAQILGSLGFISLGWTDLIMIFVVVAQHFVI